MGLGMSGLHGHPLEHSDTCTPAPPGAAIGDTSNRVDPLPNITVRPAAIPMTAPKTTSLRKCWFSERREAATYDATPNAGIPAFHP